MPVSNTLSRSHLTHSELELTKNKLIHHVHFVLSNLPIIKTRSKQFQLVTTIGPILQTLITYSWVPNRRPTPLINFSMFFLLVHFYSKIFECLLFIYWIISRSYNLWMTSKATHTHRFTSVSCLPRWCYIVWMYPFEKWMNHGTHYRSNRNEIPYPPRTFQNWKLYKTRKAIMNSEIEYTIKNCPNCLTFRNRITVSQLLTTLFQIKPRQKLLQILLAHTDITIY